MKKNYSIEQLIELAKKAKPVPPEVHDVRRTPKVGGTTVVTFVNYLGIKPGRNEVDHKMLYNTYRNFTENPVNLTTFNREMQKMFKMDGVNYKLNMKIITIDERLREAQNDTPQED